MAQSPPDGYSLIFSNNGPRRAGAAGAAGRRLRSRRGLHAGLRWSRLRRWSWWSTAAFRRPTRRNSSTTRARQPKGLDFPSSGVGSLGHLATELFGQKASASNSITSYKGAAPAAWGGPRRRGSSLSRDDERRARERHQDLRKVRLLGATTSRALAAGSRRARPIADQLLPASTSPPGLACSRQRGTPPAVVERLNTAIRGRSWSGPTSASVSRATAARRPADRQTNWEP